MNEMIVKKCQNLIRAYQDGLLGDTTMPEEANPRNFDSVEERLVYFTLPMALNYQRDSYKLWQAALKTYNDPRSKSVFQLQQVAGMTEAELRKQLIRYKLALQPNKHVNTWSRIANTFNANWGGISDCLRDCENDFLCLRNLIQVKLKRDFPYLSGPKIFNYWSFIIIMYGGIDLKHKDHISIAPDTHITKGSIILGVISESEAVNMSREGISERWREVLDGSGISPISLHAPLWFWSRNGFRFVVE